MGYNYQLDIQSLYSDVRLAELLDTLDKLHTAASEGNLPAMTTLHEAELVGWLREVVYTAQETLVEIENDRPRHKPGGRLTRKIIVLEQCINQH